MAGRPRFARLRLTRSLAPSTRTRVATLLALLFVVAFTASGFATWAVLSEPASAGVEARLERESDLLTRLYGQAPVRDAVKGVRLRESRVSGLRWRIGHANGTTIAGDLPEGAVYKIGFTSVAPPMARDLPGTEDIDDEEDVPGRVRVFTVEWPNGALLSMGEDQARMPELKRQFLRTFLLTSGATLMIALALTLTYVSRLLGRIELIARTADSVSGDDMVARVPVRDPRRADDIDQLALSVNRMLDRIAGLLASVRQVSDDVAHDLRTPLTHLKQRVDTALNGPPSVEAYRKALDGASDKIDEVLATFEALLSIGRLEAGSRIAPFHPVDLAAVAEVVVEAFRPSAEDGGRELLLAAGHPLVIEGERALITQMLANLVENALIHTPPGSTVEVRAEHLGGVARLTVEDDGPGVERAMRERIFERFFRVERSRTTPGSGLGLALAAAVAAAHHGAIRAEDAGPGLRIEVDFPLPPPA